MRISFALALCLLFIPQSGLAEDSPPNILLIIADQHTGSVMSQRGYAYVSTPGLDKIADAGVTFTRAYTTYPVCKAFRKSMMTGLMPSKAPDATQHPADYCRSAYGVCDEPAGLLLYNDTRHR